MPDLNPDPKEEAQELHGILEDFRNLLLVRMKRKGVSGTTVVVVGKLLNHIDEMEAVHCPHVHVTETEAAETPVGA